MSAITPVQYPPVITARFKKDPRLCQWFLKCANKHTTTTPHPTLGDVPVCDKCKEFAES